MWARVCARLRVRAGPCAREAVYVSVCACACGSVPKRLRVWASVHTDTHSHTHARTHAHDDVANEGSAQQQILHGRSRWHGK